MKQTSRAAAPYGLRALTSCLNCPLREEGLFCKLPPKTLRQLQALRQNSFYPAGAELFVEGEAPRGVFILCNGRAKLTSASGSGKGVLLRTAEAGEVLGLSSVIAGQPYAVSATTLDPLQVNFIPRQTFLRFLRDNSAVAARVAEHLSMELHQAWKQTRLLTLAPDARGKLAKLLLQLAGKNGRRLPDGVRFVLNMSQGEIAEQIGSTRETVNRLLTDLKRRRLIAVKGSSVTLLNPEELRKLT